MYEIFKVMDYPGRIVPPAEARRRVTRSIREVCHDGSCRRRESRLRREVSRLRFAIGAIIAGGTLVAVGLWWKGVVR